MTGSINAYTFDHFFATGAQTDLEAINAAISHSKQTGETVYGVRTYVIGGAITLLGGATVVCLPGCTIETTVASGTGGMVTNGGSINDASWTGGTFRGNGINVPAGDVFVLNGDYLLLRGIRVERFMNGTAFMLSGDNIRLIDADVDGRVAGSNPISYYPGTARVRFSRGEGFLCADAAVDVAGDAVTIRPGVSNAIADVRCTGLNATSAAGRCVVVETPASANKDVRRIRFEGLTADGGAAAPVIAVVNAGPMALADVVVRDALLTCRAPANTTAPAPTAVLVTNGAAGVNGIMSDILFNNLAIRCKQTDTDGVIVRIASPSNKGIDGMVWQSGSIAPDEPTAPMPGQKTFNRQYLSLSGLRNGYFRAIGLDGSDHVAPVAVAAGQVAECRNVVFSDVAVTQVLAGATAVTFGNALRCGWVRGAVGGVVAGTPPTPAAFTAVLLAMGARQCFVEGADLTENGSTSDPVSVVTTAGYRLTGNFGSARRSAIGLGAPLDTAVSQNAITPGSGLLALGPNNATLRTITTANSQPGDLLILTAQAGKTVMVAEPGGSPPGGNLRLATGSIPLGGDAADTLTLIYLGKDAGGNHLGWAQMAASDNG